ncbi:hypothetical protein RJT34_02779 [Clitoria ternatea]|uniref:Uncharacterized protein n=1 Tax=Clitoria ternatea TaxID=43366 RepID=A0AAN9Q0K7_CLITE
MEQNTTQANGICGKMTGRRLPFSKGDGSRTPTSRQGTPTPGQETTPSPVQQSTPSPPPPPPQQTTPPPPP